MYTAEEYIEKVMTEFTSIASGAGEAGADKIRITNANIRMNEYYNPQGQLVSFPRINASFVAAFALSVSDSSIKGKTIYA